MIRNIEIILPELGKLDIDSKLIDDFGIPLVFNIDDIKDVSKRTTVFSKTIKIIGTDNNNILFNHIYDIKADSSYDILTSYKYILLVNKQPIFKGYMKLTKIEKLKIGESFRIVYWIKLNDEVKNIFDEFGDKRLRDLDFSSGFTFKGNDYDIGDHIFSPLLVGNSIDYTTPINFTNTYEYPLVNYRFHLSDSGTTWPFDSFIQFSNIDPYYLYPSVYIKTIIDKMFYDIGWSYNSNFFEGISYNGLFTKLINIYNGKTTKNDYNLDNYYAGEDRLIIGSNLIGYDIGGFHPIGNILNKQIFTDGDNYGSNITILRRWEAQIYSDDIYDITININIAGDYNSSTYHPWSEVYNTKYLLYKNDTILHTYTDINLTGKTTKTLTDVSLLSGDTLSFFIIPGNGITDYVNINYDYPYGIVDSHFSGDDWIISYNVFIYRFSMNFSTTNTTGNTFDIILSDYLPNIKQSDFLKNLIKLTNLYLWNDNDNEKTLNIEPRNDFYFNGETLDWTDKLNYNKSLIIESLSDDISKDYNFNFKSGDDFWTDQYEFLNDEIYGNLNFDSDNDNLKGENNINLDFSSWDYYINSYDKSNEPITIPNLIVDPGKDEQKRNDNPLIGIISHNWTQNYFMAEYGFLLKIKSVSQFKIIDGNGYYLFFKEPINDNNFKDNIYYSSYEWWWETYISNLLDETNRKFTCYLNLTTTDILNLNFANKIMIDGQAYNLRKINYDPSNDLSSKCEFTKVTPIVAAFPVTSTSVTYILKVITDSGDVFNPYIQVRDSSVGIWSLTDKTSQTSNTPSFDSLVGASKSGELKIADFSQIHTFNANDENLHELNISALNHAYDIKFNNNYNLSGVTMPTNNNEIIQTIYGSNTSISNVDLSGFNKLAGDIWFIQSPNLTGVTFPNSVESIISLYFNSNDLTGTIDISGLIGLAGDIQFISNSNLTDITLPYNNKKITDFYVNDTAIGALEFSKLSTGLNPTVRMNDCNMTIAEVNENLYELDNWGTPETAFGDLYIAGSNAGYDTGSGGFNGKAAYDSLIVKFWTIDINPQVSNWILATGLWEDTGIWEDEEVWIDSL